MKENKFVRLGWGLVLAVALCLNSVPMSLAAVAHQFRNASTGAALTARVDDDNKIYGDGSQLSSIAAATADALTSNPADCAANQYANTIAANGDLSCSALADADVPNDITVDLAAAASALAADPTDCSVNQFANTIAANGNLSCSAIADADVPDTITIDLAAAATALAADPTDCSANQFANGIASSGNLACAALIDADVPDTITASNYQPLDSDLTALASHYEGKDTQVNICAKTPGAAGNFMTQSDSPYQIWTATAAVAAGQWIGMFNGLGPC